MSNDLSSQAFDAGNGFDVETSLRLARMEDRIEQLERKIGELVDSVAMSAAFSGPNYDFTGVAYVNGAKFTGLTSDGSKPWVKCDRSAITATEETGPPSDPFPPSEEWFEKAAVCGDIHVV